MTAMAPRVLWVIYGMSPMQTPMAGIAVCQQREWEKMEQARPGFHRLIQGDIPTEAEAEKLARNYTRMKPPLPMTQESPL